MKTNSKMQNKTESRFSLSGDVNGLFLVLGILVVLLLLPGPTEAEYQARDIKMNDIVVVNDLKK